MDRAFLAALATAIPSARGAAPTSAIDDAARPSAPMHAPTTDTAVTTPTPPGFAGR